MLHSPPAHSFGGVSKRTALDALSANLPAGGLRRPGVVHEASDALITAGRVRNAVGNRWIATAPFLNLGPFGPKPMRVLPDSL